MSELQNVVTRESFNCWRRVRRDTGERRPGGAKIQGYRRRAADGRFWQERANASQVSSSLIAVIVVIWINRSESMREHKVADLVSVFDPIFNRKAEMNSSVNSGFTVLDGRL